jgi:glucose/arabinose dehydrogenase
MALGDGQEGFNAQNLGSLKGKIIRINPKASATKPYTIPPDNPFVGVSGARPEIWHLGLRNPWKWSFDKATGEQWIADVGADTLEEIDKVAAGFKGGNFGWNLREGSLPFNGGAKPPGAIDPFYEYPHDATHCSITGGFVYRGSLFPELVGNYVFTDYCGGEIRGLTPGGTAFDLGVTVPNPVSFGQDSQGELWILSIGGGVHRLVPA